MEKRYLFSFLLLYLALGLFSNAQAQIISRDSIAYYAALLENPNSNNDLLKGYNIFVQVRQNYNKAGQPLGEVYALGYISRAQLKIGAYNDAEQSSIEALEILRSQPDSLNDVKRYKTVFYNQLGILYKELEAYDRSRKFYKKAKTFQTGAKDLAIIENNIGSAYTQEEHYAKALVHHKQALDLLNQLQDTSSVARARYLNNLGFAQVMLNQSQGFQPMHRALEINASHDYQIGLFMSYKDLTRAYLHTKQLKNARTYANKLYALALKSNNTPRLIKAMELQLETGNYQNFSTYKRLNDSVTSVKQSNKNQYAALKYNNEQARADANAAQLKYEQAAFEKQQQEQLTLIFILLSVFILSSAVLIYFYVRARNRKRTIQEVFETENRISKQIHDDVANNVFQVMTKLEEASVTNADLLTDLETLYFKTRDISKEYSEIQFSESFEQSLRDLISTYSGETTNIITKGWSTVSWSSISQVKQITIYKVLQELLINMKKHSDASLVVLSFKETNRKLELRYTDNGKGATVQKGSGLQNAENRIDALGGSFTFDTQPHQGFKAIIYV